MKLLCFAILFWIHAIFIPPFKGVFIESPINIFCQQHLKFYTAKINIYVCPKFHYHLISIKDLKCPHKYITLTFFTNPTTPTYQGYYHTQLIKKDTPIPLPVVGGKQTNLGYVYKQYKKQNNYILFF